MKFEHCKNCIHYLDSVNPGSGSKITITRKKKIQCTYSAFGGNWHPFLVLCSPSGDNRRTPILRKNIISCSEFKSVTYLNENIWVDIYEKEN